MSEEMRRRYKEMVARWEGLGHPQNACSGHTYPLPDCPAPQVHARVFPPENDLTFDKVVDALKAVYQNMDSTGRAGDEWAYEWIREVWPGLVPEVVRRAVEGPDER